MIEEEVIIEIERISKHSSRFKIVKEKQSLETKLKHDYLENNATVEGICRTGNKDIINNTYSQIINHFIDNERCLNEINDDLEIGDSEEYAIFLVCWKREGYIP